MPIIKKPMLASNFDESKAVFPYIATPKVDGIRFVMVNGVALSRSFKPIRNKYIQEKLSRFVPDGIDGELTSGDNFQTSTSAIMSINGEPDFKVWVFDYVDPNSETIDPFYLRMLNIPPIYNQDFDLEVLYGSNVNSHEELKNYEDICLSNGFEGLMVRDPMGTYKFGRSSVKENILLKVKRFDDSEAILVDVLEKMSNQNLAEQDAFGHVKRSSALDGMVPCGTAGTLIARDDSGNTIRIGSGLDDKLRWEIWRNKDYYIGQIVKFKYFAHGVKDLPRHPVFLGFRSEEDL